MLSCFLIQWWKIIFYRCVLIVALLFTECVNFSDLLRTCNSWRVLRYVLVLSGAVCLLCLPSFMCCPSYVPQTSLSRPPWPELPAFDAEEEERRHRGKWRSKTLQAEREWFAGFESDVLVFYWLVLTAVVQKVNGLIEEGAYGRLFAVVHFASRQWKVTDEDLILIENHIDAACGDRIRMEKVFSSAQTLHSDPHTDYCAARWPAEAQVQGWDFCTFWPQWEDPCKCFWVIVVIQMASWVLKQF